MVKGSIFWSRSLSVFVLGVGLNTPLICYAQPIEKTPKPFVVLELFTSEGCSSCPPADQLLATLSQEAHAKGRSIYALSFHVDYWNDLGWKDPFSRAAYTQRQKKYAEFLNSRVYTPQLWINGEYEIVGSRESKIRKEIENRLQGSKRHDLERDSSMVLEILPNAPKNSVSIAFHLKSPKRFSVMNIALVEKNISVSVHAGENGGQTLAHQNVVREFRNQTPDAQGKGNVTFLFPKGKDPKHLAIVAYLQDMVTWKILDAREMGIP